jgi:type II secretory pathway component PulF
MRPEIRAILIQVWCFIGIPFLGIVLVRLFGLAGFFLCTLLFALWCWELFAYFHYRFCRQEEFLSVLRTAAATRAPVEQVLRAYLNDRPKEEWYRFWVVALLLFVFPGYYMIHMHRSFDTRLRRVLRLLHTGYTLDQTLRLVPGTASRDVAAAALVGQFGGKLPETLQSLPVQRPASRWLEAVPRVGYPLIILGVMFNVVVFAITFVIPKYERMFAHFKLRLPAVTQTLISSTRGLASMFWIVPACCLLVVALLNVLLFSSFAKWYCPVIGRLYRLSERGKFLHTLGLMLETDRPLPAVMDRLLESELLPRVTAKRVERLATDLDEGRPFAESLVRHGLLPSPMQGLIEAAGNARNLPWALQELGLTLSRRSTQLGTRIMMVLFPLTIFLCACLVAFVAVSLFYPLVALMEHLHAQK